MLAPVSQAESPATAFDKLTLVLELEALAWGDKAALKIHPLPAPNVMSNESQAVAHRGTPSNYKPLPRVARAPGPAASPSLSPTDPARCPIDLGFDIPRGKAFCCYILASDRWPTPYTGKTCDLARRLRRHNNPSPRSRAYTKGKGPWRVAAAVFGLRSNRQSVWLERALKKHAKHRARPAGLNAAQTAVLHAVRVASRPNT